MCIFYQRPSIKSLAIFLKQRPDGKQSHLLVIMDSEWIARRRHSLSIFRFTDFYPSYVPSYRAIIQVQVNSLLTNEFSSRPLHPFFPRLIFRESKHGFFVLLHVFPKNLVMTQPLRLCYTTHRIWSTQSCQERDGNITTLTRLVFVGYEYD